MVNTKKKNPVHPVNPVKEKDYDRISGFAGLISTVKNPLQTVIQIVFCVV
ncbi:MAG: hypothetical protein IPQ05_05955 [Leptospiraceae bacterium]|nr:hypothetical protein [Leptospiraceae bacterium]